MNYEVYYKTSFVIVYGTMINLKIADSINVLFHTSYFKTNLGTCTKAILSKYILIPFEWIWQNQYELPTYLDNAIVSTQISMVTIIAETNVFIK